MKNIRRLSPLSVMFILFAFVFFLFISFHGATGNGIARSSGDLAQAVQNFKSHSTDKNNTISSDSGHQALVSGDGQTVTWYNQNGQEFQSPIGTSDQATQLFNNNGYYNYKNEASSNNSILLLLLTNFLPFLVMGLILWWVIRQARSGNNQAMSFGRSKHRLIAGDKPSVTFADVAGVEEAKVELNEIVEFLKYPDKFKNVGARIPKGVLMVGSPGTGKTLLSKAVAGEAGVPFFSISGSEFVEMFVGVGASVTGDTPVLVKTEEGVKLLPIREVVDSHYEKDSEGFPIKINGLQTLGYSGKNQESIEYQWSQVSSVYRHKVSEIYEIEYVGGAIRATGNHSVFIKGTEGSIQSVEAASLKIGDELIELPAFGNELSKIWISQINNSNDQEKFDSGPPIITKISIRDYEGFVYDFCGCINEAFFGGTRPVLLHNSRVRDLFEQAKKNSPCIVFVDEIDAVGRQRGAGLGGGHDEREQTLNQLLVEMDGFETNDFVIVIAATNRPDVLDPALLRPGRFDRQVVLDRPDIKGRRAILDVHARNRPLESNVNLDVIAKQTPGFTGADLANLLNEAAIFAARANKKTIGMVELEEAIARVIAGPERKSRMISEREKRVIAYHEMGHALVINSLENTDPVHKITIVSRGMALGWTMSLPQEDKVLVSREELRDQMAGMLGGRCAEEIFLKGNITTGASDDIDKATNMARRMVVEWGMSEKLGPRKFGSGSHQVFLGKTFGEENKDYSEEIAGVIDEEIARLVTEAHDRARAILIEKQTTLKTLAERLIEIETMEAEEMKRIIAACENGSETPNLVVVSSVEETVDSPDEAPVSFPEPPPAPPTA